MPPRRASAIASAVEVQTPRRRSSGTTYRELRDAGARARGVARRARRPRRGPLRHLGRQRCVPGARPISASSGSAPSPFRSIPTTRPRKCATIVRDCRRTRRSSSTNGYAAIAREALADLHDCRRLHDLHEPAAPAPAHVRSRHPSRTRRPAAPARPCRHSVHLRHDRRSEGRRPHPRQSDRRARRGVQGRPRQRARQRARRAAAVSCARAAGQPAAAVCGRRARRVSRDAQLDASSCARWPSGEITIFACVPQFFYLIHQRLMKEVARGGVLTRSIFRRLLAHLLSRCDAPGINIGPVAVRAAFTRSWAGRCGCSSPADRSSIPPSAAISMRSASRSCRRTA